MSRRSIAAVLLLSIVTLGIYGLVWFVQTKKEMKSQGADIPSAWLIIIPLVSIYWMWKYSGGVEVVTGGKTTQAVAFLLLFLLGPIGAAIIQDAFNKVATQAQLPAAAVG
jgi:uncharacterized membrane protein YphA (DoxX/SURF4 family)